MRLTIIIFLGLALNSLGQIPSTLDNLLLKQFPDSSQVDGRFVYYRDKANVEKRYTSQISILIPNCSIYKIDLTNYLGYHINKTSCLILYDSTKSTIILVPPIWFSDISEDFLKLFIGAKFNETSSLMKFIAEFQELMINGSTGQFENTKLNDDTITFDYTYESNSHKKNEVWRNFEVGIKKNTIKYFKSTNPAMKESTIVK